ncbi:MAG: GTP-binding protein, partial [Clostridia bacterium]|nr:GTP-binding protein [Clostridia bacterium]
GEEHEHHHHHDHDGEEHEHHHHYDENGVCSCGHHHHHHHHGHDADEVFTSWGVETVRAFGETELSGILAKLEDEHLGLILRAKGIVPCAEGGWLHFDYTPGEQDIRRGPADYTGRLCVIGSKLDEAALSKLFGVA